MAIRTSLLRHSARSFVVASLAFAPLATAGCDDGSTDVRTEMDLDLDDAASPPTPAPPGIDLQAKPNVAQNYDFDNGNAAIELVIPAAIPIIFGNVKPGDATIVLRFTTMITNAWFDAIAPYHETAVGVYSDLGRRPESESETNANMNIALLYASHKILTSLAPQNSADFDGLLLSVGLDPNDDHEGTEDAIGIGNAAGRAIVEVRENDGMNQLGDEGGRTYNRQPYSDYTGYAPRNTAYALKQKKRWQPRIEVSRYGITRIQHFVTPQYALVLPYSYEDPMDFSVPPPAHTFGNGQAYKQQADEVLAVSANLTDEQKLIAELFDDKIRSLGFSSLFASISHGHTLEQWVHYDFLANVAAFDAGIIVWQEKTKYDAVRPFSAIRHIYGDSPVTAWGGPGQGTVSDMPASEWKEYLNVADHPEYPSGSANFCSAHAQASRLFFGDDNLGWTVPAPAGSSIVEPGVTPAQDMALFFPTWTDFEEKCALSRLYGGVHFRDAIEESSVGTQVGTLAYEFVMAHINGTVP